MTPEEVFSARFEAYWGHCDPLHVPDTLTFELFWDQKMVDSGPTLRFLNCALGPAGALNHVLSAFCGHFGLFGQLATPKDVYKSQTCVEMCPSNKECGKRTRK